MRDIESKNDINSENKEIIKEYLLAKQAEGISQNRLKRIYITLKKYARNRKPFTQFNQRDLERLIAEIRSQDAREWTKVTEIKVLKSFFRWLKERKSLNLDIDKIKVKEPKNSILPEYLLTDEEIGRLLEAADPYMRVLIGILYESGARIGEILGLKIKHVSFTPEAARLMVSGKTGQRMIPIVWFRGPLLEFLRQHPCSKDPEAPLFYHHDRNGRIVPLPYNVFRMRLQSLCKKAGITKRVYPHLFRHTRLTQLAPKLSEQVLKRLAGWTPDSDMAQIYIHLSQKDVEDAILSSVYGIKTENTSNSDEIGKKTCPICKETNPNFARFCWRCSSPLDENELIKLTFAYEKIEEINRWSRVLLSFIKILEREYPDMWNILREVIEKEGILLEDEVENNCK